MLCSMEKGDIMEKKNVWESLSPAKMKELEAFSGEYIDFLSRGKTERECADLIVDMAEKAGYRELPAVMEKGDRLKVGEMELVIRW